jgi:N-acyl-D-aspartate/D-glutamate deacylase
VSEYSLVVRNGTVVDGLGTPSYRADIGVDDGRIVTIGRIRDRGRSEIDAEGHVVTPGFIDGHTHMDAQLFWDPLGTSACWHGVTTAVVGNCGFTLAPVQRGQHDLVLSNLERAEDIPREALEAGLHWGFEHFGEYLDVVDAVPKAINYAAQIGHSALRTWAMGERAFDGAASEDDLTVMVKELEESLRAGAFGFTTSRSSNHIASDGRPVASRLAEWSEVEALVDAMGGTGGGIFELSNEAVASSPDPASRAEYAERLLRLAVATQVPITFGITSFGDPVRWREQLALLERSAGAGGRIVGQTRCRESAVLYSFKTWLPFDSSPLWREVRSLALPEQARLLRDEQTRRRLVDEATHGAFALGPMKPQPVDWQALRVLDQAIGPNPSVAEIAAMRGVSPADALIDLSLESDFDQFFVRITGNAHLDEVETILRHPRTVMTFSDSGAHVSQMINSCLQTHLIAFWVRDRQTLTLEEAVRMITLVPATLWGIPDRGAIREGAVADLNVFDPATIGPDLPRAVRDLPGGATRLTQTASGFLATVVAGQTILTAGEPTGALPGSLLRRARSIHR